MSAANMPPNGTRPPTRKATGGKATPSARPRGSTQGKPAAAKAGPARAASARSRGAQAASSVKGAVWRLDLLLPAGRMAALAVAGAIEGLLLANSPVLERYTAVRLGPEGVLVDLALLFAVGLAAVGCVAALAPWAHATFVALLVASASWSLAESSLHPFWIFSNKGVWRPHPPAAGVVVAHVAALALVCAAALGDALQAYRRAALAQSFAPADLLRDLRRLARNGALLLGATVAVAVPLLLLLDGAADNLVGAVRGRTAFTVLVGSAALMLVGLGLLASQARPKPAPPSAPRDAAP